MSVTTVCGNERRPPPTAVRLGASPAIPGCQWL